MALVDLTGKHLLVTGASSGIGRACAILAAKIGARVVLTGRREGALEETRCQMANPEVHSVVPGDISSPDFIRTLVDQLGKLDGLVHAAGMGPMCPVGIEEYGHFEEVFRTNAASFALLMKAYSKSKYRNGPFSAVAVSSVAAYSGWAGVTAYASSKGALSAMVRSLAMELASKKIRVNAVCPSNIKTPMYEAGSVEMNDEVSLTELIKKQPLGLGMPEQVAAPVCFLLSDAASFITGVNLPVDGGYLAQ